MSSCLESLNPVGRDFLLFREAETFGDKLKKYGLVVNDLARALEVCELIPESDRKRIT